MKDPSQTSKALIKEISQLKQRIQELEQSDSKLRKIVETYSEEVNQSDRIFNAMNNSVCVIDPDGRIIKCNRCTEKFLGRSSDELKGHFCFEMIHGTSEPLPECPLFRMKRTKHRESLIIKLNDRWLEVIVDPMLDSNQRILSAVHVIVDITERKRAEEALRESEDKLKSIFRAAPVGIGVVSDRVIMEVNDRLCTMTGYSREEMVGQGARMLYPDVEDFNFVGREKYRQISETGTGTVETRWRMKNGKVIHVILSSAPFDLNDMSRGVTFTALDVSHLKLTEEALLESEKRYRTIVENINDGIYIHDFQGNILDVNENACRMVGYTHDELVGESLGKIDNAWHLPENPELEQLIQENSTVFERENIRKDGSVVPVEVSVKIMDNTGNGVILGCVRDITGRKKAEEDFLRIRKLESLGILAGGIAHDFNNLMTVLLGYVELAMIGLPVNHTSYPLLKAALQSADQTRDLTSRLITFSQGGSLVKQVNDVAEILREVVQKIAVGNSIQIVFDIGEDLWPAEVDEIQMRQVFYNLSINAVEAMPKGTLKIKVENTIVHPYDGLSLREGPYLKILFVDDGIGIAEEDLARIFDPYFTTKHMGSQKGMGLGLSVCYSVLKKHNGRIAVMSTPGKGTTFTLYLPALVKKIEDKVRSVPVSHYRVLIMEDEVNVRKLERAFLTQLGCEVIEVTDGEEALARYKEAMLSKNPFDLVILDLIIRQGMGGKQTMENLRREDPSVRAIIVSGYIDDPVMEYYRDYGFLGVLKKPFRLQKLQEVMTTVMGAKT